jgi:succinyl-CoA synthetase alpha subunit
MSTFPIIRRSDRVVVIGMTGGQGTFWTERMREVGTQIVAGVNPKRAGETHLGLPVFASVNAVMRSMRADVAVMFVPPAGVRDAALDVIESGVGGLVMLTEHVPAHDMLDVFSASDARGCCIVGPNTAGLVTPGEAFVGIMPGHNNQVFSPGRVGVISRSGSLGTLICLNLTRGGFGQSSFIGIGGDPMIGTTSLDALKVLDRDDRTDAVVLVGEIGGTMEEEAAEYARTMHKPVVAFIAGRAAPPGRKMGHAGAIVAGSGGSYLSKRAALEAASVTVVDTPNQIVGALAASSPALVTMSA